MPGEPPPLKSVTAMARVAARLSTGAVPPEDHRSLPVPAPGPTGLRVGFLFAPVREHEDPETHQRAPRLWAPEYVAWVQAETGALEELRLVSAADLGVEQAADAPLAGPVPPRIEAEGEPAALFAAYDAVLGWFAAGQKQVPPPVRARVVELDALFRDLAEPALLPFYRSVGKAFFAWASGIKGSGRDAA